MPRPKEIVARILGAVCAETEIPCELIMSKCSRNEVVDARWIAVFLLHKAGIYVMTIADHLRITPRYVQYIITDFGDRIAVSRLMRMSYEAVRKRLGM